MEGQYINILSNETIGYLLSREEVVGAKARVNAKASSSSSSSVSEQFTVPLTPTIRSELFAGMGLKLSHITAIPMRWVKGDTPAHHDTGISGFTHTHLVYLTDSVGDLVVDGVMYPIRRGYGYIFSEGVSHETVGTYADSEPRLLLGPISETGFAVGASPSPTISLPGGTTVYIRQTAVGEPLYYSVNNMGSWNELSLYHTEIINSDQPLGLLTIEFVTDITLDGIVGGGTNGYFICRSDGIQFGSRTLKPDGTRPVITIDGITDYPGLIQNGNSGVNGYNTIYITNLEIRASGGSTLADGCGWIGQAYFGKGTTASSTILLNCHSTGDTGAGCGGIVGQYAGPVKCVSCSSAGSIG
ncbi:hypothetical protein EBR96_07365, partial [bacterium]|nr:hypothetical protein [bacterium]